MVGQTDPWAIPVNPCTICLHLEETGWGKVWFMDQVAIRRDDVCMPLVNPNIIPTALFHQADLYICELCWEMIHGNRPEGYGHTD